MKTISLLVYNRPEYLKQVLSSLRGCIGISDYTIVVSAEPGCSEVIDLVNGIDFCNKTISVNKVVLGVHTNKHKVLSEAFSVSDTVIDIEEDTVLARDCLLYFEQCFNDYRNDKEIYSIGAFGKRERSVPEYYHRVFRYKWFSNQVWGTWKDRWEVFGSDWCFDWSRPRRPDMGLPGGGWDWQVNYLHRINKKCSIVPFLARFLNIGEDGLNCKKDNFHRLGIQNPEWAGKYNVEVKPFHE